MAGCTISPLALVMAVKGMLKEMRFCIGEDLIHTAFEQVHQIKQGIVNGLGNINKTLFHWETQHLVPTVWSSPVGYVATHCL